MSDLIERQAARHALCKAVHKGEDIPCENQTASCLWTGTRVCDYVREIDALPTVQPEQHWIPCSERLPGNDNEVLITVWDAEDDYVEVYKGFYQGHEWWTQWCHGCSKIKDEPCGENIVIAWMPLPEPYHEEVTK